MESIHHTIVSVRAFPARASQLVHVHSTISGFIAYTPKPDNFLSGLGV